MLMHNKNLFSCQFGPVPKNINDYINDLMKFSQSVSTLIVTVVNCNVLHNNFLIIKHRNYDYLSLGRLIECSVII